MQSCCVHLSTKMGRFYIQKRWIILLVLLLQSSSSWGWFFSSNKQEKTTNSDKSSKHQVVKLMSEFSMDVFENSQKGIERIENAERKMLLTNSCWQRSYQSLFSTCRKALPDEELKSRLSWNLCDCFQQHTGRSPLPYCDAKSPMTKCLQKLDSDVQKIYLEFYIETFAICHQLQ